MALALRILIIVLISLTFRPGSFSQNQTPEKHALVVAISKYSPASDFRPIDADNDLKIITKLLRQQGFTDTIVLRNDQATKEGFVLAFRKLLSNIDPGDVVFIHFSTHGQQIEDLNNDEVDGMDEAIAMYDSKSRCSNEYKGENHLTDDEFGKMIGQLRKGLGKNGDILVMIDACHSGTMTRGLDTAILRGGYAPIMISGNESGIKTRGGDSSDEIITGKSTRSLDIKKAGTFSDIDQKSSGNLANYVIFSACENNEVSSEYCYNHTYFGPLTWAFLNSLLNNSNEDYTYKNLFHDIRFEMISMFENYRTKQNPTMDAAEEGENKTIFGGQNLPQKHFYTVTKFITPDKIIMAGGNVSGIFDSTTVMVYPSGTLDPAKSTAKGIRGTIVNSGYLESTVQLDSPLNDTRPGNFWIFVANRKLGGYKVMLDIGLFTNGELKKQVLTGLKNCSFVEINPANPSFILEQKKNGKNEMILMHARSRKPYRDKVLPENLMNTIQKLAQVQLLKNLRASSPDIDMEISMIPSDTLRFSKSKFLDQQTLRNRLKEKADTALLTIVNTGKKEFYFNLVDIDPEDNFSIVLPNNEVSIAECFLPPGKKFQKTYVFQQPYGTETLKFIASGKKFDLRPVFNNMETTRGVSGDLENLFGVSSTMRGSSSGPEPFELATFTFYFDIIK